MAVPPPKIDSENFSFWEVLQNSTDHSGSGWPTRTAPPAMSSVPSPYDAPKLPAIGHDDPYVEVVKDLLIYIVHEVSMPASIDHLRHTPAGYKLRILVDHLVQNVTNPALINALLTLKYHFSTIEASSVNETRANSCEIVAWRFLSRLSERDAAMYCLYELPKYGAVDHLNGDDEELTERTTLLPQFRAQEQSTPQQPTNKRDGLSRRAASTRGTFSSKSSGAEVHEDPLASFAGMNALEIAVMAKCKKFLGQKIIQRVIEGIWKGDIVFWDSLSATTKKKPHFYNKNKSDIFTRLRVPRYIKTFEIFFFATFLILYYTVLVERDPYHITGLEILLYVWFVAFAYTEVSEFLDTNSIFYAVDIWNGCDIIIVLIGIAFFITRVIGIHRNNEELIDSAFDILAMEALFMVPRICSILTLHPYFGILIPCLEEMIKDFLKYMVVVVILYIGFLTTFTLLARETFSLSEMSWFLVRVFLGGGQLGFEIMRDINPKLGPPLMVIFICMTNILLITSLICIQRDSFARVMAHAREEYLFVYSVYVLGVSTNKRLTHFYPPLNLIPLVLVRPLRLVFPPEKLRHVRILLLKATHLPIVGMICLFEIGHGQVKETSSTFTSSSHRILGPPALKQTDSSHSNHVPKFTSQQSHAATEDPIKSKSTQQSTAGKNKNPAKTTAASNPDLEDQVKELSCQVKDLSSKIAELTAIIMAQQSVSRPDDEESSED